MGHVLQALLPITVGSKSTITTLGTHFPAEDTLKNAL